MAFVSHCNEGLQMDTYTIARKSISTKALQYLVSIVISVSIFSIMFSVHFQWYFCFTKSIIMSLAQDRKSANLIHRDSIFMAALIKALLKSNLLKLFAASYPSSFNFLCCHDNDSAALLVNHMPEIFHSAGEATLSSNISF